MNESQKLYTTRKKTDTKTICCDFIYMIFLKRQNYSDRAHHWLLGVGDMKRGLTAKGRRRI